MTLFVDYGNNRIIYPYSVLCNLDICPEQAQWCRKTFKNDDWHYYNYESAFYFKRERDMMLFKLRWT